MPLRPACWKLLARPKSVSLATVIGGVRRGGCSRLDVTVDEPCSCAKLRPSRACWATRRAHVEVRGFWRWRRAPERLPPAQYSIAK